MAADIELIAAIYDAIVDPSGWDEVVKRIVEATKSVAGGLGIRLVAAEEMSALCNTDPYYIDLYVQHYYKTNPLHAIMAAIAPGEVRSATPITQTDSFKASALCNDLMLPQGWADILGVGLFHTPKEFGLLTLYRSPGALWVEPPEWRLLETLAPHLKRAGDLSMLLSRTKATTDSLGTAVAAAGFAVFLLTGDWRVLFANAKAESLVRCQMGFRYENGRLAAASPTLTARLHALARGGARPDRDGGDIGGTLELPCGENCPPLVAHLIPLAANRMVSIFDIDRPAAAVFVIDSTANFGAQVHRFAAKFWLTAAETRVLSEIIGGQGLLAAAARLKITEATARTHAKHILSKTGTNRQTELIRRFFETRYPGSPAGV